jgi:hypothetical protein
LETPILEETHSCTACGGASASSGAGFRGLQHARLWFTGCWRGRARALYFQGFTAVYRFSLFSEKPVDFRVFITSSFLAISLPCAM